MDTGSWSRQQGHGRCGVESDLLATKLDHRFPVLEFGEGRPADPNLQTSSATLQLQHQSNCLYPPAAQRMPYTPLQLVEPMDDIHIPFERSQSTCHYRGYSSSMKAQSHAGKPPCNARLTGKCQIVIYCGQDLNWLLSVAVSNRTDTHL